MVLKKAEISGRERTVQSMLGEKIPNQIIGTGSAKIEVEPDVLSAIDFIMFNPGGTIGVGIYRLFHQGAP